MKSFKVRLFIFWKKEQYEWVNSIQKDWFASFNIDSLLKVFFKSFVTFINSLRELFYDHDQPQSKGK